MMFIKLYIFSRQCLPKHVGMVCCACGFAVVLWMHTKIRIYIIFCMSVSVLLLFFFFRFFSLLYFGYAGWARTCAFGRHCFLSNTDCTLTQCYLQRLLLLETSSANKRTVRRTGKKYRIRARRTQTRRQDRSMVSDTLTRAVTVLKIVRWRTVSYARPRTHPSVDNISCVCLYRFVWLLPLPTYTQRERERPESIELGLSRSNDLTVAVCSAHAHIQPGPVFALWLHTGCSIEWPHGSRYSRLAFTCIYV